MSHFTPRPPAQAGLADVAALLVRSGAPLEAKATLDGWTPLEVALGSAPQGLVGRLNAGAAGAAQGVVQGVAQGVVQGVVQGGASASPAPPPAPPPAGLRLPVVRCLLELGALPTPRALVLAAALGSEPALSSAAVRLLLEGGADPSETRVRRE